MDELIPGRPRWSGLIGIMLVSAGFHDFMGILLPNSVVRLNQMARGLENTLMSP